METHPLKKTTKSQTTPSIKSTPPLQKVLLRLVTLNEQHKTKATVQTLAQECGCSYAETMAILAALAGIQKISLTPIDANEFSFNFPERPPQLLKRSARDFNHHLLAKAKREARRKAAGLLPPQPPKFRDPHFEALCARLLPEATELTKQLGEDKAYALAQCASRLGMPAVKTMVAESVGKLKPAAHFFWLYRKAKKEMKLQEAANKPSTDSGK